MALSILEKDRLRKISSMSKTVKRGCVVDRARLCHRTITSGSVTVPSARTRRNGHKLELWMFTPNIKKHFFTVCMTKSWHRGPREGVEFASLVMLKSHLDTVLGNWL